MSLIPVCMFLPQTMARYYIEETYIQQLANKVENKEVNMEEEWVEKLTKIQNNQIKGPEKVFHTS